jgi:CRP/FNR family transcriptional regulator/CRP/FNR family cyclic AMP-dependent transcriptional regulator
MTRDQPLPGSWLRHAALLAPLPADDLRELAEAARSVAVRAGEEIFHQGDPGEHAYWVVRGFVRVSGSKSGTRVVFELARAGDVLGEMAVFLGQAGGRRTATATAASDCLLAAVHRRDLVALLRRPEFGARMLALLSRRLARTSRLVEDVVFRELPERLASCLVRLCRDHGEPSEEGIRLAVPLTQSDLGEMIGMSRESINKQVGVWQREGVLEMRRGQITVRRPERLEALLA